MNSSLRSLGLTDTSDFYGVTIKFTISRCKQDMDIYHLLGDGDVNSFSAEEQWDFNFRNVIFMYHEFKEGKTRGKSGTLLPAGASVHSLPVFGEHEGLHI